MIDPDIRALANRVLEAHRALGTTVAVAEGLLEGRFEAGICARQVLEAFGGRLRVAVAGHRHELAVRGAQQLGPAGVQEDDLVAGLQH